VTDGGRPQDQGRTHRARGRPSAETVSLLERYQASMRDELAGVLVELEGKIPAAGLLDEGLPRPDPVRPSLADRARLWDLAIKLGRELGSSIDPTPPAPASSPRARRARSARVDFG
jgi:hypothetical protein